MVYPDDSLDSIGLGQGLGMEDFCPVFIGHGFGKSFLSHQDVIGSGTAHLEFCLFSFQAFLGGQCGFTGCFNGLEAEFDVANRLPGQASCLLAQEFGLSLCPIQAGFCLPVLPLGTSILKGWKN